MSKNLPSFLHCKEPCLASTSDAEGNSFGKICKSHQVSSRWPKQIVPCHPQSLPVDAGDSCKTASPSGPWSPALSPRLPFLSFLMFSPLERRCQGSFMYCKFIVLEDFIHKCNAKVEGPGCSKSFMYSFLAKLQMSRSSQSQHKFHDTWGQGFPLLTQQLALDIQWLRGINTYQYNIFSKSE